MDVDGARMVFVVPGGPPAGCDAHLRVPEMHGKDTKKGGWISLVQTRHVMHLRSPIGRRARPHERSVRLSVLRRTERVPIRILAEFPKRLGRAPTWFPQNKVSHPRSVSDGLFKCAIAVKKYRACFCQIVYFVVAVIRYMFSLLH